MASHHPMIAVVGWLGMIGAAFGAARAIYTGRVRDRRVKLRELVDQLALEVRDSIAGR
jgi:hypothetical protein